MTLWLDHLVVTAATLDEGVRWCVTTLGVIPGPGGKHPLMGTHNRLVNIGSARFPQAYLEIIAIDPGAPAPPRVRWFGLAARPVAWPPRLTHLVLRCADITTMRATLLAAGQDPGVPTRASRETPMGRLQWQISIRDDGAVMADGAPPTLIQWPGPHPTQTLGDHGITLQSLTLSAGAVALPVTGAALADSVTDSETDGVDGRVMTAILRGPLGDITLHTDQGNVAAPLSLIPTDDQGLL